MTKESLYLRRLGSFSPFSMIQEIITTPAAIKRCADELVQGRDKSDNECRFEAVLKHDPELAFLSLQELTKEIHEWQHFIDFCGTTFGYRVQWEWLILFYEFRKAILNAKTNRFKLPLQNWANKSDCPEGIRQWITRYDLTEGFYLSIFGDFELQVDSLKCGSSAVITLPVAGGKASVNLPIYSFRENYAYVVGAKACFETKAFLIQIALIVGLFGRKIAIWFLHETVKRMMVDPRLRVYIVIPLLHLLRFGKYFPLLDFAVSDSCLMGRRLYIESLDTMNPGQQYLDKIPLIITMQKEGIPKEETEQLNLILHNIVDVREMKKVCQQEIEEGEQALAEIDRLVKGSQTDEVDVIIRQRQEYLLQFMKLLKMRILNPRMFLDPGLCLSQYRSDEFPRPFGTVRRESILAKTGLEIQKDEHRFAWWWMLYIEFMNIITKHREIVCPLKKLNIDCSLVFLGCGIGQVFSKSEKGICDYGVILQSLSLDNKILEAA